MVCICILCIAVGARFWIFSAFAVISVSASKSYSPERHINTGNFFNGAFCWQCLWRKQPFFHPAFIHFLCCFPVNLKRNDRWRCKNSPLNRSSTSDGLPQNEQIVADVYSSASNSAPQLWQWYTFIFMLPLPFCPSDCADCAFFPGFCIAVEMSVLLFVVLYIHFHLAGWALKFLCRAVKFHCRPAIRAFVRYWHIPSIPLDTSSGTL